MRPVSQPAQAPPARAEPTPPDEEATLARIARWVFAAGLVLVPVLFDVRTLDVFNLVKITALWVFGLVALGIWLCSTHFSRSSRAPARSGIIRAAIVLLAVTFVSSLLSGERVLSFVGFYHRYEGFVSLALYVGVLIFIAALYRGRLNALREIAIAVAAAAGVLAVYVIFQKAGVDFREWHLRAAGPPPFPIGSLGNSSFTASYLGIALPFMLYLALSTASRARRVAWMCVGLVTLVALWFTQGRAGMSAAAVGFLAFFLYSFRFRTSIKVAVIALVLLVLALVPIVAGDVQDPAREGVLRTGSAGYRAELWEVTWRMALERPLLGSGPETYFGNYPHFRKAEAAKRDGLLIPDSPHSIYLTWATNTGFVGLAAFLFVVALALTLAGRRSLTTTGPHKRLTATFAAVLAAYLGQSVYSLDVPPLALMCWVALGGLAVLTADARPEPAAVGRSASFSRFIVPVVIGIVVVVLIVLGLRPLRADHAAWAATQESLTTDSWSDDAFGNYEKAVTLHPLEPAYRGMLAEYLERHATEEGTPYTAEDALVRASALYGEAHDLQPRNIYYMISLANVNARLGKVVDVDYFRVAQHWIQRVERIDRLDPHVYDIHIKMLEQWASELQGQKRRDIQRQTQLLREKRAALG